MFVGSWFRMSGNSGIFTITLDIGTGLWAVAPLDFAYSRLLKNASGRFGKPGVVIPHPVRHYTFLIPHPVRYYACVVPHPGRYYTFCNTAPGAV
jgi:hypothetical protein